MLLYGHDAKQHFNSNGVVVAVRERQMIKWASQWACDMEALVLPCRKAETWLRSSSKSLLRNYWNIVCHVVVRSLGEVNDL